MKQLYYKLLLCPQNSPDLKVYESSDPSYLQVFTQLLAISIDKDFLPQRAPLSFPLGILFNLQKHRPMRQGVGQGPKIFRQIQNMGKIYL